MQTQEAKNKKITKGGYENMRKKALALLMAGVMLMGCFPATANAANTGDTAWKFSVSTRSQYTSERAKGNQSSTYIRLDEGPNGYVRAAVEGKMPVGDAGYLVWKNMTWNVTSVLVPLGRWRIRQTIFEDGGRSARLRITRYNADGRASGVWSPDCAGSYTPLN